MCINLFFFFFIFSFCFWFFSPSAAWQARHPVGIETVLGAIATVVNGDLNKAVLVDVGECYK